MIERGCGAAPDALECHVFDQPLCNAHVGKSVHLIQDNLVAGGVKRMQSALRKRCVLMGNAAVGKKCLFITLVGLNPTTKVSFRCLSAPPNVSQSLSVPQYSGPAAPFIPRRLC